ncbi:N(6)-L-threonylcarbamoyladenine synthase [hydrothermal vent metagenome]|uniref:N(6)-L-threonylcarbamoyladenine synthase n=1 Tax=hydrothermal vent metagenome TaxID=652676 RepID=A0A3B0RDY7_9ZZZZ
MKDGSHVLSSVISSQDEIHSLYGGIVPELASRRHIETVIPVVEEALKQASVTLDDIDAIGVTQGPGLVGSILVGLSFAKAVAFATGKPFVGVNHIEAHPLAVFLDETGDGIDAPEFPYVALVVSGGHTSLIKVESFTEFSVLGRTRDDAAGEAFDKAAKLLGLGYPGGAVIDRLAKEGNPKAIQFKRPIIKKGNLEFSFSGLKTAVMLRVKAERSGCVTARGDQEVALSGEFIRDLAASFQETVVDVLTKKALWALEATGARDLVIAGGVACNSRLRAKLAEAIGDNNTRFFAAPPRFCSDNAAMIALSGYHRLKAGERGELDMNAYPSI